jgi:transposase-like protein
MLTIRSLVESLTSSETHKISKTAIWKWVRKLSEKLNVNSPKMRRRLIALDETYVSVNGLKFIQKTFK